MPAVRRDAAAGTRSPRPVLMTTRIGPSGRSVKVSGSSTDWAAEMGKAFVFGMFGLIAIGLIFLLYFGLTILTAWAASVWRTYKSGK